MDSGYAGEEFLQVIVPDMKASRRMLSMILSVLLLFWCFVVPFMSLLASQEMKEMQMEQEELERQLKEQQQQKEAAAGQTKQRRGKKQHHEQEDVVGSPFEINKFEKSPQLEWVMFLFSAAGLVWSLVFVLCWFSPTNYFASRRVFAIPFLSASESASLLARIEATAHRNTLPTTTTKTKTSSWSNGFHEPPKGFHKTQHISKIDNTTTVRNCELSWQHHPFTKDDRDWLTQLLHARVSPTIRRLYGVTLPSIHLQDLRVDRFEAGTKCTYRERAVDDDDDDDTIAHDVAFRIFLDDDFRGGGTRCWNPYQNRHMVADETADSLSSSVGTMLLHSSRIAYEDAHVRDGQRNVLVGRVSFVYSDTTGLSAFASYFSFSWIATRLQRFIANQSKTYHKITKLAFLSQLLLDFLDHGISNTFFKHKIVGLVNSNNAENFRTALDEAYQKMISSNPPDDPEILQATWFMGNETEAAAVAKEAVVAPEEYKTEEIGIASPGKEEGVPQIMDPTQDEL